MTPHLTTLQPDPKYNALLHSRIVFHTPEGLNKVVLWLGYSQSDLTGVLTVYDALDTRLGQTVQQRSQAQNMPFCETKVQ